MFFIQWFDKDHAFLFKLLTVQNNCKLSEQEIQHGATSLLSCAPKEVSRLPTDVIQFIIKAHLQRRYARKKYFDSWFIFPAKGYSCQSTYRFLKRWFCLESLQHVLSWVYSWWEDNSSRSSEEAALHEEIPTDSQCPPAHTRRPKSQVLGCQERELFWDKAEWDKPPVPSLPTCPATPSHSKPAIQNVQFCQQITHLTLPGFEIGQFCNCFKALEDIFLYF